MHGVDGFVVHFQSYLQSVVGAGAYYLGCVFGMEVLVSRIYPFG